MIRKWVKNIASFLNALPLIFVANFIHFLAGEKIKSIEILDDGKAIRVIEEKKG